MSLDEPEPVDSLLTFLGGYDILEYSWVKATAVSVRLRILFVTLQNTNNIHLKQSQIYHIRATLLYFDLGVLYILPYAFKLSMVLGLKAYLNQIRHGV